MKMIVNQNFSEFSMESVTSSALASLFFCFKKPEYASSDMLVLPVT